MRRTIAIVCAAMLASSSMAIAQKDTNSGAGVAGKPGSKSGPAMTKSGPRPDSPSGTNPDQSNVKGMPGNKSGPGRQVTVAEVTIKGGSTIFGGAKYDQYKTG